MDTIYYTHRVKYGTINKCSLHKDVIIVYPHSIPICLSPHGIKLF